MTHHAFLNPHVLGYLSKDLSDKVILDVGCGFGEWGFLIRTRKSGYPRLIGLDVWRSHLDKLRSLKVYSEFVYCRIPPVPLKDKSTDITLACEVLEHLPKEAGFRLLAELERVTKELIIVSVPLNIPQEEIYGNPYEKHVSEWLPHDLVQQGYEIKAVHILPKTLRIVDRIRRFVFKLPPTVTKLIVARKFIQS